MVYWTRRESISSLTTLPRGSSTSRLRTSCPSNGAGACLAFGGPTGPVKPSLESPDCFRPYSRLPLLSIGEVFKVVVLSWSVSQVDWAQASREAQERAGMDVKQVLAARPSFLPPARLYRPGLLWIGDDRCHVTSQPGRLQHTGELGRLIAPRSTLLRARFDSCPPSFRCPHPTHPHNAHAHAGGFASHAPRRVSEFEIKFHETLRLRRGKRKKDEGKLR